MPIHRLCQLDELVASLNLLTRARAERLAVVTLGMPAEATGEEVRREVADRLVAVGLVGVEVNVRPRLGPPRVLSLEFRR